MTAKDIIERVQNILGDDVIVAVGPFSTGVTPGRDVRYVSADDLERLKKALHADTARFEYKNTWVLGSNGAQPSGEYEIRLSVGHATQPKVMQ